MVDNKVLQSSVLALGHLLYSSMPDSLAEAFGISSRDEMKRIDILEILMEGIGNGPLRINELALKIIDKVRTKNKDKPTQLIFRTAGSCSNCGKKNLDVKSRELYEKLGWKLNVEKREDLSLLKTISGHKCKNGVTVQYDPMPLLYYIDFANIGNKPASSKFSLPKENPVIKTQILGSPVLHSCYCLIFAKDNKYQCSVFFEDGAYYVVTDDVQPIHNNKFRTNPSLQAFQNDPELVAMFYKLTDSKENLTVSTFFEELEGYQTNPVIASSEAEGALPELAQVNPVEEIADTLESTKSTFDQPANVDQPLPVNIQVEPDISLESEYINRVFMTSYSQSVRFSMNKINNPFTKMNKKCKVCQYCGTYNPKQLELCLKSDCGKPLVEAGRGNDIENAN